MHCRNVNQMPMLPPPVIHVGDEPKQQFRTITTLSWLLPLAGTDDKNVIKVYRYNSVTYNIHMHTHTHTCHADTF